MLSILSLNNALFCVTRKYKRIAVEGRIRRLSASVEGPIHGKATFDLTPDEKKLFENLKLFVTETKLPISIRVAGGWVRDKLLSLQGKNDIDITLDSLSGIQFLDRYNRWRLRRGEGKRSYYIVKKNPSKSKHLETVACKLENLDIDFVNLRTEAYTENSRIPEIEVGTPKEDALRRDLTINSLFYNIQSGNIEDFTGQGIKDLENKIVRTPLPAIITLTDDPLRALRAIRFACRLNFNIDSELLRACQERSVHDSLRLKVSSNRVSDEIFGMLQTLAFHRSIFLMYKTRLLQTILPVPPEISMYFSYGNGNDRQEMIHDIFVFSVLLQRYISTIPTNPSVKNSSCSIQNIALKVETDKDLLSSSV
jgi:tRNA nucleotidyltransferase/poly(A) polymerase